MSTSANRKERIRELVGKRRLFHLPPLLRSSPMLRELFVSEDVRDGVLPPWPKFRTGARHIEFRETLDHFTQGHRISVSEQPFRKPNYALMARTHPTQNEVWDIRCPRQDQGIRCFGCFAGKDLFIALTWDYRENITDFGGIVEDCRQAWDSLFSPLQPFEGSNLDEYLSNYVAL
jgi:hypothetical protein